MPASMAAKVSVRALLAICVCLVTAIGFAIAFNYWVKVSTLNADEGFYLGAPLATLRGELPYRDYAFTQGPILPMINAPLVAVFPPTLTTVRWISAGWALAGIVAAFLLLRGRERPVHTVGWLVLLLASPMLLSFLSIGKTYSLAQFFLLLAAGGLLVPMSWRKRLLWFSVFGVLAAGTRLTLIPVVGLLWLGLWWLHRKEAHWAWMLGVPLASAVILLGPFAVADPQRFVFWNVTYHLQSQLVASIGRYPEGYWSGLAYFCPGIWLGALFALGISWRAWRNDPAAVLVFFAAVGGLLFNVVAIGVYVEYAVPFIVLLLVGAGRVVLAAKLPGWLAPALCGALAVGSVFFAERPSLAPSQQRTPLLTQAREAAQFLEEQTQPGDEVLACSAEIPLAAHRPLYRNMVMGKFAVTTEFTEERADRLGLVHYQDLLRVTEGVQVRAVVMSGSARWNFSWSVPSLRPTPLYSTRLDWYLDRHYAMAYKNDLYIVLLPIYHPYFLFNRTRQY